MAQPTPVVFIHGLWLHARSWRPWTELFGRAGYWPLAPGWPGDSDTVEQTRSHPEALAGQGIAEVTDHYAGIICELPAAPVVVGHCFGGLIAQQLLAQGFARACVALAPAPFAHLPAVQLTQLLTAWPLLFRPWRRRTTWTHSTESFHRNVANGVSREESDRLLAGVGIPAPTRPVFQAALAPVAPRSAAAVDIHAERGPLLLVAAELDRTAPAAGVRAAFRRQRRNPAVTEIAVFADRGHSLAIDAGWRAVADTALEFLARHDRPRRTTTDPSTSPTRI